MKKLKITIRTAAPKPIRIVLRRAAHVHRNEEHEFAPGHRANRCADCGIWTRVHKQQPPQVTALPKVRIRKPYVAPVGLCSWCGKRASLTGGLGAPDDHVCWNLGGVLTLVSPLGVPWAPKRYCARCTDAWGFPPAPRRFLIRRKKITIRVPHG